MKRLLFILFLSFASLNAYAQLHEQNRMTETLVEKKLTISPNPAVSDIKLSIDGTQANVKSISIYSIIGSEVFSKQYDSTSRIIDLDVRNLKKGKYHIRVIFDDNSTQVATLIKQ